MYTSYYDTSGGQEHTAVATAGLMTTEDKWLPFERDWRQMCSEFHVPYVHMKELASCESEVYQHLKTDPDMKAKLFARMNLLLRTADMQQIVLIVSGEDFRTIDKEFCVSEKFGSAAPFAIWSCALRLEAIVRQDDRRNRGLHYHEKGDNDRGYAKDRLAEYDIHLDFKPKVDAFGDWFVPFQAADYMSWEYRLRYQRLRAKDERPIRRSFQDLNMYWNNKHPQVVEGVPHLRAWCKQNPLTLPPRTR